MKYAAIIILQLLLLTPAYAGGCLKAGDVVSGSLGRVEGGIGDMTHDVVEVLYLQHPRCFVTDDGQASDPIDEVEVVLADYPDSLVNALVGNDVEVTLGGSSEPRVREFGVVASINSVTITHAGCEQTANPPPDTHSKYGARITASKRASFYARPAETCRSPIFVVKGDRVEVLAETDKYAFVRYVSKQKISYYGWISRAALTRT